CTVPLVFPTPDLIAVIVKNNAPGQWLVCGVTVAAMVKDCPHGLRALEVAKLIEVGPGGVLTPPEPPPPVSSPPDVVPPPPPHPRTKHSTQAVDRAKPAPRGLGLRAIVDNDRTATPHRKPNVHQFPSENNREWRCELLTALAGTVVEPHPVNPNYAQVS